MSFPFVQIQVFPGSSKVEHDEHLELVDAQSEDLDSFLEKLNRTHAVVCLIVPDSESLDPRYVEMLIKGKVDDIIISPIRPLEIVTKLRYHERMIGWKQVAHLNGSFSELLDALQEDLQVLERYHRKMLPKRFVNEGNLSIASRFIGGAGPGGDYFDASSSEAQTAFIMSHSSSYGLSSTFVSTLVGTMMKLALISQKEQSVLLPMIQNIQDEAAQILKKKDELSLFYGTYFRHSSEFRFMNLGKTTVWLAQPGKNFNLMPAQGPAIVHSVVAGSPNPKLIKEFTLHLTLGSRVAIISEGFTEAIGVAQVQKILNGRRRGETVDALSDLAFEISKSLNEDQPFPAKDCSALSFDVQANLMSLAPFYSKR